MNYDECNEDGLEYLCTGAESYYGGREVRYEFHADNDSDHYHVVGKAGDYVVGFKYTKDAPKVTFTEVPR